MHALNEWINSDRVRLVDGTVHLPERHMLARPFANFDCVNDCGVTLAGDFERKKENIFVDSF